jgi:uncharacterized membrane protein
MFAVLMIIAGYMGAVSVVTTVKWFWFLFGMAMFLPVVYSLARTFRETVITRKVLRPILLGLASVHTTAIDLGRQYAHSNDHSRTCSPALVFGSLPGGR